MNYLKLSDIPVIRQRLSLELLVSETVLEPLFLCGFIEDLSKLLQMTLTGNPWFSYVDLEEKGLGLLVSGSWKESGIQIYV